MLISRPAYLQAPDLRRRVGPIAEEILKRTRLPDFAVQAGIVSMLEIHMELMSLRFRPSVRA